MRKITRFIPSVKKIKHTKDDDDIDKIDIVKKTSNNIQSTPSNEIINLQDIKDLENRNKFYNIASNKIRPDFEIETNTINNEYTVDGDENSTSINTDYISSEHNYVQDANDVLSQPLPLRSKVMSALVGLFVAVGGFLFGYDTGLINSVSNMQSFQTDMSPAHTILSTTETSILVSFLSLGTFVGALIAPWIADRYGRKPTIIFSTAILFSIGNSLQVAANSLTLLIIGRVISGVGIGLISAVVPLYQAEAAEKNLRGAIISSYQWTITIGLLVSNAVAQGTGSIDGSASYRIPIGLQYIWSCFLALGMVFLPESPRYFILKDELHKAANSLSFLRGIPVEDPRLLEELVEIKATFDYEASFGKSSFWDCFVSSESRPKQVLRMFTGIAIQTFQQFSGINFIFYYGVSYFRNSGVAHSNTVSLICYAVNVAFNIPGMFFVEFYGRRNVLVVGGILMTISNFIVAGVGTSLNSTLANKIIITFICTFIASFSATWGGVVWVISAELFPLGVRSKCTAICAAANWISNFICALMTPYIVSTHNGASTTVGSRVFFIWGAVNAVGVVVVYFTVYETNGLKLEEINELYEKSENCFDSVNCNKMLRSRPVVLSAKPAVDLLNYIQEKNLEEQQVKILQEETNKNEGTSPHNETDTSMLSEHGVRIQEGTSTNSNEVNYVMNRTTDMEQYLPSNLTKRNYFEMNESDNDDHSDPRYRNHILAPLSGTVGTADDSKDGMNSISNNLRPSHLDTKFNYDEVSQNYVDLGNGLGLNTYSRGPPSILSESSCEVEPSERKGSTSYSHGSTSYSYGGSSADTRQQETVNEYMAQFIDSASNKSNPISNATSYSSFLTRDQHSNSEDHRHHHHHHLHPQENTNNSNNVNQVDWGQFLRRPSDGTASFYYNSENRH